MGGHWRIWADGRIKRVHFYPPRFCPPAPPGRLQPTFAPPFKRATGLASRGRTAANDAMTHFFPLIDDFKTQGKALCNGYKLAKRVSMASLTTTPHPAAPEPMT